MDDDAFKQVLANGSDTPPGPDELREIVARSRRHQRRGVALGVALALVAGGAAGYAIAHRSSEKSVTLGVAGDSATTSGPEASQGATGAAVAVGSGVGGSGAYTALFTRAAGRIAIRGFLTNMPQTSESAPASCGYLGLPSFQAELSTSKMVGTAQEFDSPARAKPVSAVYVSLLGQEEGDPVIAVVAATSPAVSLIRISFAGGSSDAMAPARGWVALASTTTSATFTQPQTSELATLTAIGAGGRVLSTQKVTMADDAPPNAVGGSGGCECSSSSSSSATSVAPAVPTTTASPPATGKAGYIPAQGSSSATCVAFPVGPATTAPAARSGASSNNAGG